MPLSFLRHRWVVAIAPLALATLLLPAPAAAQGNQGVQACTPSAGGDTCGGTGVASLGDGANTGVGNPIHIVSGNKYQVEVDMPALPGELGLEVVRHYNSAHAGVPGLVGAGWRLSYETRLHRVGDTVQILQADGGRHIFNVQSHNPSLCASDNPQLGRVHIEGSGARTRYRWEWTHGEAAGRVLHFNARGQLERIVAASGATLSLQRSPEGELLSVTDPQGRSLQLIARPHSTRQEAQAQGQAAWFAGTARIRTPLGDIQYHYGSGAQDPPQAANLVRVDSPSGQRHYHHEDPRHPAALTGISVASAGEGKQGALQRVRTWSYDERGRAQAVQHDGQELQVQILKPALHKQDGLTWVRWRSAPNTSTAPAWQEALYRHGIIGGQYRLTEALGAACATCSPTGVRYRYDASGRLQEITQLSAVTVKNGQASASPQAIEGVRHVYGKGQDNTPTLSIERVRYAKGQPQAAELIERQHFADPHWSDKPTRIERPSVVAGLTHSLALRYNAAGQITELTESGFSPLTAQGQLASSPQQASAIGRTQRWSYQTVAGVSVLTAHDGPLPNGPKASPEDSDITRFTWDARGTQLLAVERSSGRSEVRYTEQGWIGEVGHSLGQRMRYRYNGAGQLIETSRQSPGQNIPWVQQVVRDAQGRITEVLHPSQPGANWAVGYSDQPGASEPQWWASASGHWLRWNRQSDTPETDNAAPAPAPATGLAWPALRPSVDLALLAQTIARDANAAQVLRLNLSDDFGRLVLQRNPNHGQRTQAWDEADRLIAMQDALGHRATYRYDAQGRIAQQDVLAAGHSQPQTTRWHYAGACLVQLEHPTQSERYRCDAAGRRTERVVVLHRSAGQLGRTDIQAVTRYRYDDTGTLVATQLPDGSTVHQRRDGLGRLSEVTRQRIATPWLAAFAPEQMLLHEASHDMRGLAQYSAGNGMQTQWQRSSHPESFGTLARLVHRKPTAQQARVAQRQGPNLARSPQELIEMLLGVRPAHAQAVDPPPQAGVNPQGALPGENLPGALPGALGLPNEPQALIDQRYLWAGSGELLLSQGTRLGTAEQHAHAFDAHGQLVASVRSQRAGDAAPDNQHQSAWAEQAVWRFAYDAQQRRVLAQQGDKSQGVASQSEITQGTQRSSFEGNSARLSLPAQASAYNANGQPQHWGQRSYTWDALGRLSEVQEQGAPLARYTYDHRGLRVGKAVGEGADQPSTYTLYSQDHSPQAELDGEGRVQRLYLWLSPQDTSLGHALPLAVVDRDTPSALIAVEPSLWQHITQAGRDALLLVRLWVGSATDSEAGEHTAWLHSNHLGAPELATDRQGQLIWQARYSPFGAAQVQQAKEGSEAAFVLHLRLPGQIFDPETGLHYNRQRYYDPQAGQYLTPDPLGTPDGPNPYAYVAFNPLTFIDPDGLILFAFDGTENDDPPMGGSAVSNVVRFRDVYDDGNRRYVSGVGTTHEDREWGDIDNVSLDAGVNRTGTRRIERMFVYLLEEARSAADNEVMQIDIVGFSRGAAQARDFANKIVAYRGASVTGDTFDFRADANGWLHYNATVVNDRGQRITFKGCQRVNFRFMGLWDTVLSTNSGRNYQLSIPAQFKHVAHAIALNEYRSQPFGTSEGYDNGTFYNSTRTHLPGSRHWGGFPLESIGASSNRSGQVRIERGFIGAHADIGGGYGPGEDGLSSVALSWMVAQAQIAGVSMRAGNVRIDMNSPVVHDQSNMIRFGNPQHAPEQFTVPAPVYGTNNYRPEDRQVNGAVSGTTQRTMGFGPAEAGGNRSLTNADSHQFIQYWDRDPQLVGDPRTTNSITDIVNLRNRTGAVDMPAYMSWLRQHGYVFAGDY